MSSSENKTPAPVPPVDVVQKNNPLVKGIAKMSKKWSSSWPDIEQPWPVAGTLSPDVIKTICEFVTVHKAQETKGRKGRKRAEKRKVTTL